MSVSRFLQIHYLTAFPGTLLNRDDAGLAKRLPFGGTSRIRISSQCLKRHWRRAEGDHSLGSLGVDRSIRSRATFAREIFQPLLGEGLDRTALEMVLTALKAKVLGKAGDTGPDDAESPDDDSAKRRAPKRKPASEPETNLDSRQVVVLGRPEVEYLKDVTRATVKILGDLSGQDSRKRAAEALEKHLKAHRPNFRGMRSAGLDAALFGRMVTSDILARGDAAIHVAHAFTVHAEEAETDYFSAVDDLLATEQQRGSAHIGETELTSGLYYGYVVVDVPLLVSNLEGCAPPDWGTADRSLAGRIVDHLIHLVATVSPGAKKGSTAPYAYAELVLVESGSRQPRTLANAYMRAVSAGATGDLWAAAADALRQHLAGFDRMYGRREERRVVAQRDVPGIPAEAATSRDGPGFPAEAATSLDDLAAWAAGEVEKSP